MTTDLETEAQKLKKNFKCDPRTSREVNTHAPSGPHYCRNHYPGRENCPYRGSNIPYQTGPGSVGGRAYQCSCRR